MDRSARREYLQAALEEIAEQRRVDVDQLFMELIHFSFELDDALAELDARVAELEKG